MIDTSLLVALYSTADAKHAQAARVVTQILRGEHGQGLVSDLVVAETLNYMVAKSRDPARPERVARDILGEEGAPWLELVRIDAPTWSAARERFRALSRAGLSFTDCTSIALMQRAGVKAIASFDAGFDGLVTRVH